MDTASAFYLFGSSKFGVQSPVIGYFVTTGSSTVKGAAVRFSSPLSTYYITDNGEDRIISYDTPPLSLLPCGPKPFSDEKRD